MIPVLERLGAAICVMAVLSGCTLSEEIEPFDESSISLLQLAPMQQEENIAVVTTNVGEFKIRFFPSEAPKAVGNFIELAEREYFDGRPIERLEYGQAQGVLWGTENISPDSGEKKPVKDKISKEEISYNLCPISGAVMVMDSKQDGGNSSFFILGQNPVEDGTLSKLLRDGYPQAVVEAFERYGGYPQYWMNGTIFAQVIEGMDVIESIIQAQAEADDIEDIIIESIEIQKYEE